MVPENPSLSHELPLHAVWVRRLARRLVRDESAADDLSQEVALAALRAREPEPRGPWVARVASNLAARAFRTRASRERVERAAARGESVPGAGDVAARIELQQLLVSELGRLEEPYRTALVQRFFDGRSAASIAREAGVPAATVRWRIQRGLAELRARLDRRSGGDGTTWRLALLPLARGPSPGVVAAAKPVVAALQGVLAVKLSTLLLSAGALALAIGIGIFFRSEEAPPAGERLAQADAPPALLAAEPSDPAARRDAEGQLAPEREAVEETSAPAPEPAASAATPVTRISGRCVDEALVPIDGATIADAAFSERWATRSAADGVFTLDSAAEPPARQLRVEAPGFGTRFLETQLTAGTTNEIGDVVLRPGGSVVGRVLDAVGAAFADATVSITDPRLWDEYESARRHGIPEGMQALTATSARDGSFRVDGVTAGTVRAWASADGMLHAVSAVLEVPVHGVAEVELVLEPRTGADRIAGIVLDPVGEPVSGAGLAAMRHSRLGEQWVDGPTTGADGRFSIPAAHDSVYELFAADPQDRWLQIRVEGIRPGTMDLELAFREWSWIDVSVRSGGEPVTEFELVALTADERLASWADGKQHAEGKARLRSGTGPFRVRVDAPGFAVAELGPFEPAAPPASLEFDLERVPGVRGRVLAYGEPVAGARVTLHHWARSERIDHGGFPTLLSPHEDGSATTDDEGRFVLSPRKRDTFAVCAEADGLAPEFLGPLELDPAGGGEELELVLSRGGAIEGRVLMPPGRDASGVIVGVNRGDGYPRTVRSDRDGSFRFEGLAPGPWHLARAKVDFVAGLASTSFSAGGPAPDIPFNCHVIDGATVRRDLDLSDWEPCRIEGRLSVNGADAGGWLLSVWPDPQQAVTTPLPSTATAADGRFTLEVDDAGPAIFSFRPPAEEGGQGGIGLRVQLHPGLNPWSEDLAMGSVEGSLATPLEDEQTLFYQTAEDVTPWASLPIAVDDAGRFRLPYVPVGAGLVRLLDQGDENYAWEVLAEVEVVARATAAVELP